MGNSSGQSILDRMFRCLNDGVLWSAEQLRSACPPRDRKKSKSKVEKEPEKETPKEFSEDSAETKTKDFNSEEIPPSREPVKASCYIKMQDPCASCCCEKPASSPCPPEPYPERKREPICGCDLCKKGYHDKCCDRRERFRKASSPRYFEKA